MAGSEVMGGRGAVSAPFCILVRHCGRVGYNMDMKTEYNFSKGTRGKFYHPDAVFSFPVYLEPDVNCPTNKEPKCHSNAPNAPPAP